MTQLTKKLDTCYLLSWAFYFFEKQMTDTLLLLSLSKEINNKSQTDNLTIDIFLHGFVQI